MIEKHLDLLPAQRLSAWRKIAMGTWRSVKDPSVYGVLEVPADQALAYMSRLHESTGERISINAFVGKAIAEALLRHPEINSILRFGKLYPRRHVTLFFHAMSDSKGRDLSGVTIQEAEQKSLLTVAREVNRKVEAVKNHSDKTYKKMKNLMAMVPGWLTGLILDLSSFFQYTLNLWSPLLGSPKDPLGSIQITNIGSIGLDFAFAPLVPYSKVPMVIAVGAIKDQVIAVDGQVQIKPILRLCVTFDHRLIDGAHAAKLARVAEAIFRNPEQELGPISQDQGASQLRTAETSASRASASLG